MEKSPESVNQDIRKGNYGVKTVPQQLFIHREVKRLNSFTKMNVRYRETFKTVVLYGKN